MALIPRVKVKADIEHPALASVLADLEPFAARFGVGVGWNKTTADAHTADASTTRESPAANRRASAQLSACRWL
jgi:hypothetical protein